MRKSGKKPVGRPVVKSKEKETLDCLLAVWEADRKQRKEEQQGIADALLKIADALLTAKTIEQFSSPQTLDPTGAARVVVTAGGDVLLRTRASGDHPVTDPQGGKV